ncbi:MAG: serine hydrolase domain-containing protein [Streptosporangiaceae bacterium]
MPGESRSLPGRPSLRYLRLEAKRRLAAGEFPSLHDAQTAIAREHGLPSWAALKQLLDAPALPDQESHALAQLRWVISRFAGATDPGWAAPGEDELRQHFTDQVLAVLPPATLTAQIAAAAGDLRGELEVLGRTPLEAQVVLADVEYLIAVEADPPHRVTGLRAMPLGRRMHDPRVIRTGPAPARAWGEVPAGVPAIADQACEELGLPALLLAGGTRQDLEPWVFVRGWADLEREQPLDPGHRFPAPGVAALVATTAALRLVAEGRVGLDRPVNDYLRAVRLEDDAVTVRDLLAHTGGVDNPDELYAEAVPDLATLMGPVIGCSGPRGVARPSNGGVAVLGQLIADVTRTPYAGAVTTLVLGPLGLRDSTFPASQAGIDPAAVTGYALTLEGVFQPVPARICTIQAAAGLWSTGADLVRLGLGWSRLLPESLAHEALTPQAPQDGEHRGPVTGLGWLLSPRGDMAVHAGAGPDATASLAIRVRDQRTHVVLTSRMIPINAIEARLLRAWTNAE